MILAVGLAKKVLVVAVIAAGVAAAVVVTAIPASHAVAGDTFVASVPWSSAVIASRSARTLTVLGDVEGMDSRFACGPVVKPKVSETATSVSIRVEVFNRPLPPNVACGGVGLGDVPATIRLALPLGDRTLTDAVDDRTHSPLVVEHTPALTSVEKPFVRRSTGWDESTGQVSEWWRWQTHGEAQQIDLDFGPAATAARWGPTPSVATRVQIGATAGLVWRERAADTVTSTVTWSSHDGQSHRMTVIDQSRAPMNQAAIVALARSFR